MSCIPPSDLSISHPALWSLFISRSITLPGSAPGEWSTSPDLEKGYLGDLLKILPLVSPLQRTPQVRNKQTCFCQPSRMSHFGELPDVVGGYLTKNLRKCQKSPFLGAKCTNLVTLAETRFQCYQMTALPDMNIFCQILVIFGFSWIFWAIFGKPHLVARQNVLKTHHGRTGLERWWIKLWM